MNKPILTIAIPTTPDRRKMFGNLVDEFRSQIGTQGLFDLIEIISDETGKQQPIGQKRNVLYQRAKGVYCVQWDSDDGIHPEGLKMIIEAIKNNPGVDCITYEEYVNIDGKEYKSNHSLKYPDWEGEGDKEFPDGFHFHRTPFMKSVIKTEIAKSVPVNPIRFAEDHQWAQLIKPLLKTEFHIPIEIYRYIHNSTDFNTRYGYDKD